MRNSARYPVTILGLFLILAHLVVPASVFAKGDMIADEDYEGGMQPGDPEGGDRIFDDTPFDDPIGGGSRYIIEPIGDDRTVGELEIYVIPMVRDVLIIMKSPSGKKLYPILRSR